MQGRCAVSMRRASPPVTPRLGGETETGRTTGVTNAARNATHSLAGADGARLIAALEGLARSIERSTEVTSEQRAAANEIVADTITAAKPEKPNAAKVAGTLGRFREHQALL